MLLASATSPFQRRASPYVIALAADPAAGVVVCGDSQGDVFAFALPPALAAAPGAAAARSLGQRQRGVLTHSRQMLLKHCPLVCALQMPLPAVHNASTDVSTACCAHFLVLAALKVLLKGF